MSFLPASSFRIGLGIVGVLAAVFAPPWGTLLVMIVLAIRYPAWEAPALGLLVDLLWLAPSTPLGAGLSGVEGFGTLPLFTIAGLVLLWGFEPLRREFLIGNRRV